MGRFQRSSANPWWRRLHHRWLAWRGHERFKSNTVSFIDFDRQRYKQVRFPSVFEARRVEELVRRMRSSGLFPGFVFRLESTLWVRYVTGTSVDPRRDQDVAAVTAFFATLYRHEAHRVDLDETDLHERLLDNLQVLVEVDVLKDNRGAELAGLADRLRPERVWMGVEYIDPLRKNFIVTDQGAVGIDIEAIHADQLLGIGLAKARLRWFDQPRDTLLDRLIEQGAPDIRVQYDYASLSFLAHYGVQNVFRGKRQRLGMDGLERILRRYG